MTAIQRTIPYSELRLVIADCVGLDFAGTEGVAITSQRPGGAARRVYANFDADAAGTVRLDAA